MLIDENLTLEDALELGNPTEIKNLLVKCILDLNEYEQVDMTIIKEIFTKHIYPEFN